MMRERQMSTFTSEEKLSVRLPGAPETPQGEDLEAMIARLDEKWRELKKILRTERDAILQPPEAQPCLPDLSQAREDDGISGAAWDGALLPDNAAKCLVTPLEADAIIKGVEELGEEEDVLECLARVKTLNRHLTIYAILCTFLILVMVGANYFFQSGYAFSENSGDQPGTPQISANIGVPNPAAASSAVPRTSSEQTPGKPDGQKIPAATTTSQAAELPQVEYVGSRTSNKYHYRSCKWTKFIIPSKERVFHSVAEARKAGYVPCPTCNPPLTDEPQKSAR